ncbi:MAG TPA: hypothetical protein VFB24_08045, partial [Candidatus Binatia bacterium]|nr:hypothetical protein [Candidatus Binatia bacterium]
RVFVPEYTIRSHDNMETTSVYFACFHSEPQQPNDCSGRYAVVEQAIANGDWPYDNGDDPSF